MTHDTPSSRPRPFTLTESEFVRRFRPIPNHLNPHAGWAFGDGHLFETFGAEVRFVFAQDPAHVWTLVDGGDGDLYLLSGRHLVNRVGYLVTTVAVGRDEEVSVRIPMSEDS
jgi:hypothetical protein